KHCFASLFEPLPCGFGSTARELCRFEHFGGSKADRLANGREQRGLPIVRGKRPRCEDCEGFGGVLLEGSQLDPSKCHCRNSRERDQRSNFQRCGEALANGREQVARIYVERVEEGFGE